MINFRLLHTTYFYSFEFERDNTCWTMQGCVTCFKWLDPWAEINKFLLTRLTLEECEKGKYLTINKL